uniref:Uncharacterized protein n=1 Tax=Octopus bimaculoides TaxID=37653 RepID=A0A0L8I1Y7_OCTBM
MTSEMPLICFFTYVSVCFSILLFIFFIVPFLLAYSYASLFFLVLVEMHILMNSQMWSVFTERLQKIRTAIVDYVIPPSIRNV